MWITAIIRCTFLGGKLSKSDVHCRKIQKFTAGNFNNALFNHLFRSCVDDMVRLSGILTGVASFSILVLLVENIIFSRYDQL